MRFILTLLLALMPVFTWAYQEKTPPQSQPAIDLCDFEVADYHTYFVGKSGVWVHNTGQPCEKSFSIWTRFMKRNGDDHWKSFNDTLDAIPDTATLELRQSTFKGVLEEFGNAQQSGLKVFPNLIPDDRPPGGKFKSVFALKSEIGQKNYDFVITKSGELRVGRSHALLAESDEVISAGQVELKDGKLLQINNGSGHFKPSGVDAGIPEGAWRSHGFDEAVGRYSEIFGF